MVFLAIAGTVFSNEAIKAITPILPNVPESEVEAAIAGTSSGIFETLDTDTRARVIEVIIKNLDKVYGVVIAGGALTLVLALFLPVSILC